VILTTPEKDFSGTIVQAYKHKIECEVALQKQSDIEMDFSGLMSIHIKSKCEEKR
tara:strand:+ start:353 stop:517 length:165 start_codon:yes stop_codon:yes gene_type:complete